MSRKTRRSAPPFTAATTASSSSSEPEGEDDELLEAGELAVGGDPLEALEQAGVERSSAVFILAYLHVHPAKEPDAGGAKEALAMCALLRTAPWVWSAVLATDYVRFTRALEICGLPLVTIQQLQAEVSAITAGKRAPTSPAPAAEQLVASGA
jgi:hypothetical protein